MMKNFSRKMMAMAMALMLPAGALWAGAPMTHDAMEAFLAEVAEAHDFITLRTAGKSVQGRELHLVNLNRGKHTDPWKVLFVGSQHGDEPAGREACIALIRDYAADPESLPEDVDLWVLPSINPDGSSSNGRRNANDFDLNRDHVLLSQPETRALHALVRELLPHVAVDCHEYTRDSRRYVEKGWVRNSLIMMDALNHPLFPGELCEAGQWWVESARDAVEGAGFTYSRYYVGGPPHEEELRHSTMDTDDARNGIGAYGGLSFIIESGVFRESEDPNADLEERRDAYLVILRRFVENREKREEHKAVIADARAGGLPDFIPVNFFWGNVGQTITHYPVREIATGNTVYISTAAFMKSRIVKKTVETPIAYAIEGDQSREYRELLTAHGIRFVELTEPLDVRAERFSLTRVEDFFDETYNRYQGRQLVKRHLMDTETLQPGTLYIPLDQPIPYRIPPILEPNNMYGLYQWDYWRRTVSEAGAIPVLRVLERYQTRRAE